MNISNPLSHWSNFWCRSNKIVSSFWSFAFEVYSSKPLLLFFQAFCFFLLHTFRDPFLQSSKVLRTEREREREQQRSGKWEKSARWKWLKRGAAEDGILIGFYWLNLKQKRRKQVEEKVMWVKNVFKRKRERESERERGSWWGRRKIDSLSDVNDGRGSSSVPPFRKRKPSTSDPLSIQFFSPFALLSRFPFLSLFPSFDRGSYSSSFSSSSHAIVSNSTSVQLRLLSNLNFAPKVTHFQSSTFFFTFLCFSTLTSSFFTLSLSLSLSTSIFLSFSSLLSSFLSSYFIPELSFLCFKQMISWKTSKRVLLEHYLQVWKFHIDSNRNHVHFSIHEFLRFSWNLLSRSIQMDAYLKSMEGEENQFEKKIRNLEEEKERGICLWTR